MHKPCRIVLLYPAAGVLHTWAVSALVSERPENNGRVILVTDHVSALAVKIAFRPFQILGQLSYVISRAFFPVLFHPVCLKVSLRYHIKSVLIAKTGKPWRVGIMACPDGVDVVLFHQAQILQSVLLRHHKAGFRIRIMAIHAAEFYRSAVYQDNTVFNGDRTDPDLLPYHFTISSVTGADDERVQVRLLRVP